MISIAKLAILLTTDTSGMVKGFAQAETMSSRLASRLGTIGSAVALAGFTALTTAAAVFVREGIRMTATMETIRINLDTMTGSALRGAALLDEMWTLAAKTPFSFEEVATGGKVLLALGVSAKEVVPTLRMLGDVSAGTGQQVGQLAQVFGEVMNAGRLTSNELRQFNMRGIPLLAELADMMGVSKKAIRDMVEEGEIGADKVVEAFQRMTGEGGRFFDLMDKQSKTLEGRWSTLKDSFSQLSFSAVGGSGGWLNQLMQTMTQQNEMITQEIELFKQMPGAYALETIFQETLGKMIGMQGPFAGDLISGASEMARGKLLDQQLVGIAEVAEARNKAMKEEGIKHQEMLDELVQMEKKAMEEMKKEADKVAKALFTPEEIMADHLRDAANFLRAGFLDQEMYRRQVENIKNEYLKASRAAEGMNRAIRSGLNPGVGYNTTAGAAAVNAAKAEMQRMVEEQKRSNSHLSAIEAALGGVATF